MFSWFRSANTPLWVYLLRSSLLTVSFVIVTLGALIYFVAEENAIRAAQNSLRYHAEFRVDRLLSLYETERSQLEATVSNLKVRRAISRYLAQNPGFDEQEESEALALEMMYLQYQNNFRLRDRQLEKADVNSMFIVDLQSHLLFASDDTRFQADLGESVREFFGDEVPPLVELIDRVKLTQQIEISKYGFSYLLGKSTVWIAAPIYSPYQRKMVAIAAKPFLLDEVRELLESYSGLGETGEVLIGHWRSEAVNGGISFINHFRNLEQRQPNEACLQLRADHPERFPMTHALSHEDDEGWVLESSCRDAYAIWRWLPQFKWGMVVKQDREEMLESLYLLRFKIVATSMLLFLFVLWVVYRQSRGLVSPIEQLKDAVLNGQLDAYTSGGIQEVNQLEAAFRISSQTVKERTRLLEQSKHETDLIIDSMDEGLLVLDTERVIQRVNRKFSLMTGLSEEGLTGRGFDALLDGEGLLITQMESIPVRIVHTVLNEVTVEGANEVVLVQDIRELLDAENAIRANRSKDQFLAMISHELRTPLTSIIGYAEILNKTVAGKLSEKEALMLQSIAISGRTQLTLINDVLDLSKLEAGKFEIVDEQYELSPLLREISETFTHRAAESGVQFTVNERFEPTHQLVGDSVRISQVLMNLLSNAVKFTEEGNITLEVDLDREQERLLFRVRDTGMGMSPEALDRLFKPFEQADSSITRKYGGTGLGLNISWNLVEMMGGVISVESQLGKGSCFMVSLPYRSSDVPVTATEADEEVAETLRFEGKVLLVEDAPELQMLVKEMLDPLGVTVTIANNGQEGLERGLSDSFDLVLMDKQMPIMSGLEAVKNLRALSFARPIYALTADVMKGQEHEMMDAGCDGVLGKPIDQQALIAVLKEHLRQAHQSSSEADGSSISKAANSLQSLFFERLRALSKELSAAIEMSDIDEILRISHNLKGTAGSFGFPYLGDNAAVVDRLIKEGETSKEVVEQAMSLLMEIQEVLQGRQ